MLVHRPSSIVLVCAAAFLLSSNSLAAVRHGGQYRGPGDTTPPGGGTGGGNGGTGGTPGPSQPGRPTPTPGNPSPAQPSGGTSTTTGGSVTLEGSLSLPELDSWASWWGYNKDAYLDLRAHLFDALPTTNSDGFFLTPGRGNRTRETYRPTDEQIRTRVVPALRRALAEESSNDIVTSALIALAKIGEPRGEDGRSGIEELLVRFLPDKNQEVSETATVALGILAQPTSIPILASLLEDSAAGRALVGAHEVPARTRAFAAYGLGLVGARAAAEPERRAVVEALVAAMRSDERRSGDVGVASVLALGLVPLEPLAAAENEAQLDPTRSREGELDFLLRFLADDANDSLARAHCPRSLARLLAGLGGERAPVLRQRVSGALLGLLAPRARVTDAIVESAVLALGEISTNGIEDAPVRVALESVLASGRNSGARSFALIALARMGGRTGVQDPDAGIAAIAGRLMSRLAKGQGLERAWAGLAIGVLGHELTRQGASTPVVVELSEALRHALEEERDATVLAAHAIAAGILGDVESVPALLEKLDGIREDVPRGYVAVALGLLARREAIQPIQAIVAGSKYRPELLNQAAIALGLLGDKDLVGVLVGMLGEAKGLATQAAIASALGFIGDASSIEPLVEMMEDEEKTDLARAFAAAALGLVADKEDLPWNARFAVDLNYRATTPTLVDPRGSGILDIL
jgi:HEAT repeat protein